MRGLQPLRVAGIGAWLPGAPDWAALRGVLTGEAALDASAPALPQTALLPAAERRRAPGSVRLAVEVAAQACAMAAIDPARPACVFASTRGDVAISDHLCATLAATPTEVSPTRFHNSVLNAPAGYWSIASGCTAAASAVTAYHFSCGAGLLEAAALACADAAPVLFACCDVASTGPLAEMTRTTLPFGVALLLAPDAGRPRVQLSLRHADSVPVLPAPAPALRAIAADNPANAHALALLAALASTDPSELALPLSAGLALQLAVTP